MSKRKICQILFSYILVFSLTGSVLTVSASPAPQDEDPVLVSKEYNEINSYFAVEMQTYSDGAQLDRNIINGPPEPPAEFAEARASSIQPLPAEGVLSNFPSFSWVFGCSAVAGGMIAGYYDRNGFRNIYTGPTDGGVYPLTDTAWSTWSDGFSTYPNNPLVASHQGVDGRTTKGSIDDYWGDIDGQDPYIAGCWTQHTWGTAIGDYMKTSQSAFGNSDGATSFYTETSSEKLTCAGMETYNVHNKDGTYGRKLFYEARGYTVTNCYAQRTDNDTPGGFSLTDFQAEIDAGNPVLLNLVGHSVVGYGYDGSTIYIRDTWDNDPSHTYTMPWGGTYSGMALFAVSVVNISDPPIPTPVEPTGTTHTHRPRYQWTTVPGATKYVLHVLEDSTVIFAKLIDSGDCGANTCTVFPVESKFLQDGDYRWRVHARVGGSWQPWSALTPFSVATNFSYKFEDNADLDLWTPIFPNAWDIMYNRFLRCMGWVNYTNSIAHHGSYANFTYWSTMRRINSEYGANHLIIRGNPSSLLTFKDWENQYVFQYANNGNFSVWKHIDGVGEPIVNWTFTTAVNQGGWNTLKVIAFENHFKFYINNQLVWQGYDASRSGGMVGIGFYRTNTPTFQPLWINSAFLRIGAVSSPGEDILAEVGETVADWDNPDLAPPGP